ncbi:isopenicillin N synthase-like dioxygenase [Stella humosa]|uniref:2-oxoglutarate-dependent ethylene/succinate-forming enzyme n=1 Tax=Stella humosa TaxID=94 RepID=A0A3N1M7B9_9PROT|nr:2-oxoglutarate and iron-dependent oxygenase domain-containing protein [Stella humosa]ROP99607.1 isopenicillin N synthase-like dioxygenase [Stella humosa]BBK31168.1 2OG-Fe(II) oxygenase [Stella humosa]
MSDIIPVLDLAPFLAGRAGAREALGAELRRAFTDVGFYFVVGHGVPQDLVDATFEEVRRFHALPLAAKTALAIDRHNIGYMPMRGATTRFNALSTTQRPNANEAIFFKRELAADHPDVVAGVRFRGRNHWPDEAALPGFRAAILTYCDAMEGLGRRLLPVYAAAMELPADWFDAAFADAMFTLRMSHYPPSEPIPDGPIGDGQEWGLAPHTDTSFLTLLAQNRIPGLSLRLPGGEWVDAPAPPGAFLVNGGNMLRLWTNDRFLATPHRVLNRSGGERYAIPFFMDAAHDWPIEPVPTMVDDAHPRRHATTTYGAFMETYQKSNFHHAMEKPTAAV